MSLFTLMLHCRECIYLSVTFDIEHMSMYDEIPESYDLKEGCTRTY
jgi:hypothetical protein